ncbi:hypothetical protein C8Q75DRAFT_514077 [Abortiporus biennis]|nr:hypothetical protein C8Q75DRAFT_514077 [Abortiporus biennis]
MTRFSGVVDLRVSIFIAFFLSVDERSIFILYRHHPMRTTTQPSHACYIVCPISFLVFAYSVFGVWISMHHVYWQAILSHSREPFILTFTYSCKSSLRMDTYGHVDMSHWILYSGGSIHTSPHRIGRIHEIQDTR